MRKLFALAALIALSPSIALACRCTNKGLQFQYTEAELVVYAIITDYIPAPSDEGGTAIVSIDKWWKSSSPMRLAINSLTNCALDFQIGKKYVLFLKQDNNGLYYADRCSGSGLIVDEPEYSGKLELHSRPAQ